MVSAAGKKRISIYLPAATYARLLARQESMGVRTGLPFVSVSNVAALAVDHGLRRLSESEQAEEKTDFIASLEGSQTGR